MRATLSSPFRSPFFRPSGVSRMRVLLPFPDRTYFLSERKRSKRKWWQLAEEKEALDASPNKFEFHSREAWREFKLDEDT
ncbi:hypothetical protein SAMN02745702_01335 [Desulfobaculum bizertense DSM 18034]|uniref:Uncharacterized protein n=1 Tax=Desulfobaculum bizertense DSM 18034 TaxID=1121442 RepID=A0A1T4VZD2_9BACT|nr:hypothetical protein SAMN02745702_01335 [Desulfobaculum bizertense DSM 18034]